MLVEKTPTDVIRGSFYQAAFGREATRFVFVLRHPVLVGKKGRAGCRPNDPATFFRGWLAAYDIMEADLEDLGKSTDIMYSLVYARATRIETRSKKGARPKCANQTNQTNLPHAP